MVTETSDLSKAEEGQEVVITKAKDIVQIMRVYFSRPSSLHDEGNLINWRSDGKPTILKSKADEVIEDEDQLIILYHQIVENEDSIFDSVAAS